MPGTEPIGEIKRRLAATDITEIEPVLQELGQDGRSGVKKLVAAFEKKREAYQKEVARTCEIWKFEEKYRAMGYQAIAGIDEVGRGPLAGPVVAACVILPVGCGLLGIKDSKKLSAQKREELAEAIAKEALSVGYGVISPETIDEINILEATYEAMRQAIKEGGCTPDMLLVDGGTIPRMETKQVGIVKGDALSISIGAASIVAKVKRDHMMEEMDKLYPGYGFAENKGYGTNSHMEALKALGPCPIHRRTFIKNIV